MLETANEAPQKLHLHFSQDEVSASLDLSLPSGQPPTALVLLIDGTGKGTFNSANQLVGSVLNRHGFATATVSLEGGGVLYPEHAAEGPLRAATATLRKVCEFALAHEKISGLRLCLLANGKGAPAALMLAATNPNLLSALVIRGGRPDAAYSHLSKIVTPTLFLVGANDSVAMEVNKKAFDLLTCPKRLLIISGAGHLFLEPGGLEEVARQTAHWFEQRLAV